MYNILLDKSPSEYKGYLLRTDYRIGIQLLSILENSELEDEDRLLDALVLLYGCGIPDDIQLALNGLKWFLSCGRACAPDAPASYLDYEDIDEELDETVSNNGRIAFDFLIDAGYIEGAFRERYGVELSSTRMHWFEFMSLFRCLKDTQLNDLMYYRTVDVTKLPKSQRVEMRKLQDKYKIRKVTASRKAELIACFGTEWRKHI